MFKLKKYINKIYKFLIAALSSLLAPVSPLLAQDYGLNKTRETAGLPTAEVPTVLGNLAGTALALAGSVFLFLVVYGGIIIMTAAGNTDSVKKGKNIIVWAIVGAVILSAAYALTTLVFSVFSK